MTTDEVNEDHDTAWLDSSPPPSPQSEGELPLLSGSERAESIGPEPSLHLQSSSPTHGDSGNSDDSSSSGQAGPQLGPPAHVK
jgi:hypothetical protein